MNRLEPGVDIGHQEIRWTWWKRGVGLYLVFTFVLLTGISEIAIATILFCDHRFGLSAAWMGAGPWFHWVLAVQMAGVGLFGVIAAGLWLRHRCGSQLMCAIGCGCISPFLGPSHEPTESGVASMFWAIYAIKTLAMVFWISSYIAIPYIRTRQRSQQGT
jgi:hypothetical protein